MYLKIVEGLSEDDNPKPLFRVEREVNCSEVFDYYGVIIEDTYTKELSLYLYDSLYEAINKYNSYKERLDTTIDPIEYDIIKNLCREVVLLKAIKEEGKLLIDTFQIDSVYTSNKNYKRIFPWADLNIRNPKMDF